MQRMFALLSALILSAVLILGCDGGDDLSDASLNRTSASPDTIVLTGIVVTGQSFQGTVQAINTLGETASEVNIGDGQHFTLDLPNYGPFLLRLIPDADPEAQLFSFARAGGPANITPFTHLAIYLAVGPETDLETMFHEWDGSQVSPEEVETAAATVKANLASLFDAQGLDHRAYDLFHTAFERNDAGMGTLLKQVHIHIDPAANKLNDAIQILSPTGRQIATFDAAIDVDTPPAPDHKQTDQPQ
jgi:hypothetical protein